MKSYLGLVLRDGSVRKIRCPYSNSTGESLGKGKMGFMVALDAIPVLIITGPYTRQYATNDLVFSRSGR